MCFSDRPNLQPEEALDFFSASMSDSEKPEEGDVADEWNGEKKTPRLFA